MKTLYGNIFHPTRSSSKKYYPVREIVVEDKAGLLNSSVDTSDGNHILPSAFLIITGRLAGPVVTSHRTPVEPLPQVPAVETVSSPCQMLTAWSPHLRLQSIALREFLVMFVSVFT
jgi:hypothetical protein